MFVQNIRSQMETRGFDPSLIRSYELLMDDSFQPMVHFMTTSVKHRMFRGDDGRMTIIREEQPDGDIFYGQPVYVDDAIAILEKGLHPSHAALAQRLRDFMA